MESKHGPRPMSESAGVRGRQLPASLIGLVMVAIAAAIVPAWMSDDPVTDQPLPAETPSRPAIRTIQLTTDGRQADVVRYPAEWQTVDVETGNVVGEQQVSHRFQGGMQRIGSAEDAVVYLDSDGCYRQRLGGNEPPERVIAFEGGRVYGRVAASIQYDVVALASERHLDLWSITKGALLASLNAVSDIAAMQWSPEGERLLVLMTDGTLEIRDRSALALQQSAVTDLRGYGRLAWAQAGSYIAAYNDAGQVATWNLTTNQVETHATDFSILGAFALAPRGDFIVLPDLDSDVWILPTQGVNRERRYLGTADALVSALCLFNEGQSLLVGTSAGTLECWSTITGLPLWNRGERSTLPEESGDDPMSPMDRSAPFAQHGSNCDSTAL